MEIVDISDKHAPRPGEVPRDKLGRPRIRVGCETCGGSGKVPSEKVAGRLNKCQKCKGEGHKEVSYTRMTTFIDCLEDKTNLSVWKQRVAVIGMARDAELLAEFAALVEPNGADKQAANALIERAERKANAELKADIGTALHEIVEDINNGDSPGFVPEEFRPDVEAYQKAMAEADIQIVATETFVVHDRYKVGGTFDILGLHKGRLKIMDLKTGTIDYGLSKMAMQFKGYADSELYDAETGERSPLVATVDDGTVLEVDQDEALLIHLPAGQGHCAIYPVAISDALAGLELAREVRAWRSRKFEQDALVSITAA